MTIKGQNLKDIKDLQEHVKSGLEKEFTASEDRAASLFWLDFFILRRWANSRRKSPETDFSWTSRIQRGSTVSSTTGLGSGIFGIQP